MLPPAIGPAAETLAGPRPRARGRLLGVPLLPVHPRPAAARGTPARADHQRPREAARAPMGNAIVGDVALALRAPARSCSATSERPTRHRRAAARRARRDRTDERLGGDGGARRGRGRRTASRSSRRRRARSRCATACACRGRAATTSARAAASASGSRRRRRPARPAGAPGRVRARRGLGAVRDHGAVDRRRLQRARSRSSCCATRST